MVWIIGIIKFIFAAVAVFTTCLLITNTISSIISPEIVEENGVVREKGVNARYIMVLIMSAAWAIVIALP